MRNMLFMLSCRRPKQQQQQPSLVVEISRHRYGGRLVSLHSCVQLVNGTALPLQLGCIMSQAVPREDPLPLTVLGPGEAVWLPLQVGYVHLVLPCLVWFAVWYFCRCGQGLWFWKMVGSSNCDMVCSGLELVTSAALLVQSVYVAMCQVLQLARMAVLP
jgi:hypothetical protein